MMCELSRACALVGTTATATEPRPAGKATSILGLQSQPSEQRGLGFASLGHCDLPTADESSELVNKMIRTGSPRARCGGRGCAPASANRPFIILNYSELFVKE